MKKSVKNYTPLHPYKKVENAHFVPPPKNEVKQLFFGGLIGSSFQVLKRRYSEIFVKAHQLPIIMTFWALFSCTKRVSSYETRKYSAPVAHVVVYFMLCSRFSRLKNLLLSSFPGNILQKLHWCKVTTKKKSNQKCLTVHKNIIIYKGQMITKRV